MPNKLLSFRWKQVDSENKILKRGEACIDSMMERYDPQELKEAVISINGLDPNSNIILDEVRFVKIDI